MVKCVFCGKEQHHSTGVHLIKNTGTVNYFCSSKCRKNSEKLKRDKRKIRWTEAFHITREKARTREAEAKEKAKAEKKEDTPKKATKVKK
ncbi:MAG: 50S ribosomal protein L24e [archaeon]